MSPDHAPAHLLVIDRDERLRILLQKYLKTRGFLVSNARDTEHARRLLAGLDFDLILLDNGAPGARALRDDVETPVLFLTDKAEPDLPGIASMTKPFEPKALCERINAILHRDPPAASQPPRFLHLGTMRFDTETAQLTQAGSPIRLTATEVQLMRIFAANPGRTFDRGELVAQLGREGLQARARAIDVQITRLRRKIEDDPKNPRYLQTVRGAGYMLATDEAV